MVQYETERGREKSGVVRPLLSTQIRGQETAAERSQVLDFLWASWRKPPGFPAGIQGDCRDAEASVLAFSGPHFVRTGLGRACAPLPLPPTLRPFADLGRPFATVLILLLRKRGAAS